MFEINGYKLGAIKSPFDSRDYLLKAYLPKRVVLPSEYSYREKLTPVKNQMGLGACVAFASCAVLEYIHEDNIPNIPNLSELYLYTKCKQTDGNPNEEGTDLRTACDAMQVGVCSEHFFPYIDKYPAPYAPSEGADEDAVKFRLGTYASANISQLREALYSFSPLVVAIAIYENFDVDANGFMKPAQGQVVGGHAICGAAFKDTSPPKTKSCCLFGKKGIIKAADGFYEYKNSWSEDWGDVGYFKIRYKDLPKVFWEARSIVDEV